MSLEPGLVRIGVDPYRSPANPNLAAEFIAVGLNAIGRITYLFCNKQKVNKIKRKLILNYLFV